MIFINVLLSFEHKVDKIVRTFLFWTIIQVILYTLLKHFLQIIYFEIGKKLKKKTFSDSAEFQISAVDAGATTFLLSD